MSQRIGERHEDLDSDSSVQRWLTALRVVWSVLRVSFTISLWLLLFLSIFLGYLTTPAFFLLALLLAYVATRLPGWLRRAARQSRNRECI